MGKKAQKKRERKAATKSVDKEAMTRQFRATQLRSAYRDKAEKAFQASREATRNVLRQYKRIDSMLALNVSDMWPENVASPVKHLFAWSTLLELEDTDIGVKSITSYQEFKAFAEAIYAASPDFPMLEDFSPEADWGQIRVRLGTQFVPMFYGSVLERTPDFVEAFRITYANHPDALAQIDLAVAVQASIIDAIPYLYNASIVEPEHGHVTTPSEEFWDACRIAFARVASDVDLWRQTAGPAMDLRIGAYKAPSSSEAFSNAVMHGVVLPFLAVADGTDWIPISVRSGPGVVIDRWAAQGVAGVSLQTHRKLGLFVAERFEGTVIGPLKLVVGEDEIDDLVISCVTSGGGKVYVICACDHVTTKKISGAVKLAYAKLRRGESAHFRFSDGRKLMLSKDGATGPSANETRILLVLTQSSTALGMVDVPDRPAKLMPLADFISILDSLDDFEELERYWNYVDGQRATFSPFSTGAADLFASFRDSHGVLVEGAMSPDWIGLDPHWGTSWRFRELERFWSCAPRFFPDASAGWNLSEGTDGVVVLNSRHHKAIAYSTSVKACTVQAVITITPDLEIEDGRLVDLFAQLLTDSMYRCQGLISDAPLFRLEHLVLACRPDSAITSSRDQMPEPLEKFPAVVLSAQRNDQNHSIRLKLNVRAILAGLNAAKNGSFEIRCLIETLAICHRACGLELPSGLQDRLEVMVSQPPRYNLAVVKRHVDVPDYVVPIIPSPTEHKLARRHLAFAMKDLALIPGRYELVDAKNKIDPAGKYLKAHIEERIKSLDRHQLLRALLEQHDALLIAERMRIARTRQSLSHAVEYDRLDAVEDARKEFGSAARDYRYLLEKVISSEPAGTDPVSDGILRELIGLVDWYMVMTQASDVLHNAVDVGGVEIDDSFIPDVFYSPSSEERKTQFAREYAKSRLGVDINEQDTVEGASAELLSSQKLRHAFLTDAGFELQHLLDSLAVLSQAQRRGFGEKLALSYSADQDHITQVLVDSIEGLQLQEAGKIVDFLTLSESGIRRLAGRDVEEPDVPYWEHKKRVHRYAIRPLVRDGSKLRWGAETASRAMNVWMSSVRDGYLPASFAWSHVEPVIKQVKEDIEKRLEFRTEEIFLRHTPYVVRGRDFYKTYRGEGFDDAGDFDVLAFWPATNLLVAVECKYNQPTHTMKDSRRLRDQIFGKAENDRAGQLSRILRRRQFVAKNRVRMLELLKWPTAADTQPQDVELYVGRDIFYWMNDPPYPVLTKFTRIDALDAWIRKELLGNLDDDRKMA